MTEMHRFPVLYKILICLAAALFLIAQPAPVRAEMTSADITPVIAMFGDSITKGTDGSGTPVSANLTYYLKKYLGVTCDNYGVSSMGYLRTVPKTGLRAYDKISATNLSKYNTFILCFGVNDDKTPDLTLGAYNSTSESTVVGQMRKCIKYIQKKKPGSRIIILAPFMSKDKDRAIMRSTFKKVADSLSLPFIDQTDSPFNQATISGGYSNDGIHPNATGYKKLGSWLSGKVRAILGIKTKMSSVSVSMDSSFAYTGSAITPQPVITASVDGASKTLKKGTDYTLSYSSNEAVGTATVKITGKGSFTGSVSKTFSITKIRLSSVTPAHSSMIYTGFARTQTRDTVVKATVNGTSKTLTNGTDYKITYTDNINAGTATMTVTGIGNYKGTITKTFEIRPVSLGSVSRKYASLPYTGTARTQNDTTVVKASVYGKTVTLTRGKDYRISYINNKNVGTATMTVTGIGNFTGTIKKTFRITPVSLESVALKYTKKVYTGSPITQTKTAVVKADVNGSSIILTLGEDYTITYQNNTEIGTAVMIVTGIGNYTGTIRKTFEIVKK